MSCFNFFILFKTRFWFGLKILWLFFSNKLFTVYLLKSYRAIINLINDLCEIPGWQFGFDFVDGHDCVSFEDDIQSQLKVATVIQQHKEVFLAIIRHKHLNEFYEQVEKLLEGE